MRAYFALSCCSLSKHCEACKMKDSLSTEEFQEWYDILKDLLMPWRWKESKVFGYAPNQN